VGEVIISNEEWAPFALSQYDEGGYGLTLGDFDDCWEIFEEYDYEPGGYGWHGVAEALIRLRAPHLADKIEFDPEASLFAAYGTDRAALEELARLMKSAMMDEALLRSALESTDPELMD
jgi:hypothetical protein